MKAVFIIVVNGGLQLGVVGDLYVLTFSLAQM